MAKFLKKFKHNVQPFEPDEVARRILVRFLVRIKVLSYERHARILSRFRP